MNGSRYATAFFMTRALLTTCGRNILPAPNRSPTTFMPSISGPSMMSSGRGYFCRASSTSGLDEVDDAVHERVREPRLDRRRRATRGPASRFVPAPFTVLGELDQPLGRVGRAG